MTNNNLLSHMTALIVREYRASSITPEDTGNLKNHIVWELSGANKSVVHIGGSGAEYAVYLEFGEFAGSSTTKPNRHKKFVENVMGLDVLPKMINDLKSNYKEVRVTINGNRTY